MKFALASDLHLVFGSLVLDNEQGADCLILAGDIYEASELPHKDITYHYVREFFHDISRKFRYVVWVFGNHEFYGSHIDYGVKNTKNWLKAEDFENVIVLDNESCQIGGVHIHGATLWTDINRGNPIDMQVVKRGMNDFDYIDGLTIDKWLQLHDDAKLWLESAIKKSEKNVVVTHHHPSFLGVPEEYKTNILNSAYFSDLSELIYKNQDINVWCCGHIHDPADYMLYNTRVLCNPRGYRGYERVANNFKLNYFEV